MGCKTGEFATMDTNPQPTPPTSLPTPTAGAIDYGNHVIEALLKMSSDTDDDEEDTVNPLLPNFSNIGGSLYSGKFSAIPQQIATNHDLPAGLLSSCHSSGYTGQDPQNSEQYLASPQKIFSPLEKRHMSPHWQKLGTPYSKDDSVLQQNSSFEYGSEKRAYSNDEFITPITPRLEKKPTYLNLSCMGKYELYFSSHLHDPVNIKPQSASSISSLTDSYPAFTGDTSDCPYGQNYNKPRGLTKFEYHSSYIKQCQIERTARTKKVWEKSSKQRQILSRKRKLMKQRKAEGNNELTSPNLSNPDQNKHRLSSASKPHRKKRLIHSKSHSRKDHESAIEQTLENTDILNKAIGYLEQEVSNIEEFSGHLAARPKRNCLDSRLSVNQSDTSYPASSRTWSTPESGNADLVSSNYSIFKSHVDQSQFTSSPFVNASNSSVEQVPGLLFSSSSLNLSSVKDSSSLTESLFEGPSDKCNQGFALRDEVLSSSVSSSQNKKPCNKNIPPICIRLDHALSDSSVSLSTSLGERPDCVGQSCSSNTDSESEELQNSDNNDTSQVGTGPNHIANILSSTRNSQDLSTPERKGPVIISPLSSEKDFPNETEEQKQSPHNSFLPDESFVCPLPPKTRIKKINSVNDKNTDKICTQLFPFIETKKQNPDPVSTSSSSSSHKKLHSVVSKQLDNNFPISVNKPMSSLKGKKDLHQIIPEPTCKTHSGLPTKYGSIYFTPVSLSSTSSKPSLPFSNVCSNISSEDQANKSPSRHKTHRRSHAKSTDKTSPDSATRRRRAHLEHRKSGFNNKENKGANKCERPNEHTGLAAAKVPRGSSKPTTNVVSKDSGLGACRSSNPSQFWATPYTCNLSDTPEQLVIHGGQLVTEETNPTNPTKHHGPKDGFHLRDKKAVIKNFWNFHKKFIRKDRKTKGDTEFKTLAHF